MNKIKSIFNKIFSKEDVNNARQIEVDIAKAICILGMAIVHCFEFFPLSFPETDLVVYIFIYILNTCFGATTFVVCMGLGLAYTRKNEPIQIIKRGFIMLLLSFVFNFFRFTVVDILLQVSTGEFDIPYLISSVFFVDILTFAGLALMLFGLLKLFKTPYWVMLLISLAMATLGTIFNAIPIDSWIISMLVCPFLPVTENAIIGYNAYFPLFNWFIFVVLGYGFGIMLKKVQNKGLFYGIVSGICGLFTIIYLAICIPNKWGLCYPVIANTMFIKVYDSLVAFVITIAVFGLHYAVSYLLPNIIKNFISFLSNGLTKFYVIHWLVISFTAIIILLIDETWTMPNQIVCILMGIGVFIVSCLILFLVNKIVGKIKSKRDAQNS
ncbi:MAG: heparan-alpha-glucosaminide N-acetyltransferase domain-containing protein [Bacilli bacterium]|nr:heparan-alpha-glucosaminide N-acetyltransferase domain-containing protein [Bacilli bacterium]